MPFPRLPGWLRSTVPIHLAALLALGWNAWLVASDNLGVNPIQALMQNSGDLAILFLFLSLSCTPLSILGGWRQVILYRRVLGLYAFAFAAVHLAIFVGLDFGFDLGLLWLEFTQKRFIWVGASAFLILLVLAGASFKPWMKRLGKLWKPLNRLVYLAGALAVLHFAWARKGDLFSLQGDIAQPAFLAGLWLVLMLLRLPTARRVVGSLHRWRSLSSG